MNIAFFKTFITLSNTGSFSKTASHEYISQSTVSSRIKELEKNLQTKLFDRKNGRITLTEDGKTFLPYAEKMLALENEVSHQLKKSHQSTEEVMITSVHAFYDNYLLPKMAELIDFEEQTLNLKIDHSREVINNMFTGKWNLGFSHHPCNHSGLSSDFLFEDRLVLVCGKYDEQKSKGISLSEIGGYPFVNTSFLDRHIEELILEKVKFSLYVNIGAKVLDFIYGKDYLALFPESYVQRPIVEGKLVEIPIRDYCFPPVEYYCIRSNQKSKLTGTEKRMMESFTKRKKR